MSEARNQRKIDGKSQAQGGADSAHQARGRARHRLGYRVLGLRPEGRAERPKELRRPLPDRLPPDSENNPNPSFIVDPPGWLRALMSRRVLGRLTDPSVRQARRKKAEARRRRRDEPHVVDYFHQLDDPYSHLAAQVLATFAARYDVVLRLHLI